MAKQHHQRPYHPPDNTLQFFNPGAWSVDLGAELGNLGIDLRAELRYLGIDLGTELGKTGIHHRDDVLASLGSNLVIGSLRQIRFDSDATKGSKQSPRGFASSGFSSRCH